MKATFSIDMRQQIGRCEDEYKEALIGVFSDDPINWLKWGIVFAILIGGYIIAIPLYGKVSSRLSWERKRILREAGTM